MFDKLNTLLESPNTKCGTWSQAVREELVEILTSFPGKWKVSGSINIEKLSNLAPLSDENRNQLLEVIGLDCSVVPWEEVLSLEEFVAFLVKYFKKSEEDIWNTRLPSNGKLIILKEYIGEKEYQISEWSFPFEEALVTYGPIGSIKSLGEGRRMFKLGFFK
ncbi:hypothetical protein ACFL08_04445 [Patescibacteria group bacterium]